MNRHYLDRYNRLIEYRRKNPPIEGEMHHIIPRCMGGSDDDDNLVFLPYREHYIAHYILAKAYPEEKGLWFAFNMMKRVCEGKSALYEAARKYISDAVSKSNSGRKFTDDHLRLLSEATMNTLVVEDSTGKRMRVSKNDPRYISGELKSYRFGYAHSEETKEKMSQNGIRGRRAYHDPKTKKWLYVKDESDIPEGHIPGMPVHFGERMSNQVRGLRWWSNMSTGETIRIPEDKIPDGSDWVRGRKNMKRDSRGRIIKPK